MCDDDFIIVLTNMPPAYEIRAFCRCALTPSGVGCMRRPRARARRPSTRRRSSGPPRGGGGEGDDDGGGDPPPRWPLPQKGGRP